MNGLYDLLPLIYKGVLKMEISPLLGHPIYTY